eukprot:COSAG05_NODE_9355_length_629_cov_1.211321_1_plen_108_part_10
MRPQPSPPPGQGRPELAAQHLHLLSQQRQFYNARLDPRMTGWWPQAQQLQHPGALAPPLPLPPWQEAQPPAPPPWQEAQPLTSPGTGSVPLGLTSFGHSLRQRRLGLS